MLEARSAPQRPIDRAVACRTRAGGDETMSFRLPLAVTAQCTAYTG